MKRLAMAKIMPFYTQMQIKKFESGRLKEEIGSFLDRSLPIFLNPSISQFSLFKDSSVVKALAENTIGSGLHPISSFTFFWNEENR